MVPTFKAAMWATSKSCKNCIENILVCVTMQHNGPHSCRVAIALLIWDPGLSAYHCVTFTLELFESLEPIA